MAYLGSLRWRRTRYARPREIPTPSTVRGKATHLDCGKFPGRYGPDRRAAGRQQQLQELFGRRRHHLKIALVVGFDGAAQHIVSLFVPDERTEEIGRASCRERV